MSEHDEESILDGGHTQRYRSWLDHPAAPILSYCGSSILMTILNKYVLSPGFNLNFFLICFQSLVCIIFVQICKSSGIITYRDFEVDAAKKWFPISLFLVTTIYSSSKAIQLLSIPIYTIFRNLTIILIAYGEVIWFRGSNSWLEILAFILIVLSSIIAAWDDILEAFTAVHYGRSIKTIEAPPTALQSSGYVWMMINCLCAAAYVLSMRKRIKLTNFKDLDTMFYNNLLSTPVLLALTLLTEDWTAENLTHNFPPNVRGRIIFAMILTGLGAACISYTSAWCVRVSTGATFSMVGALNKIPIALSGFVFFDNPVTVHGLLAIVVGSLSGIVYGAAKHKRRSKL